jgi:N-acetylmuramoyl-L-alanine amidase
LIHPPCRPRAVTTAGVRGHDTRISAILFAVLQGLIRSAIFLFVVSCFVAVHATVCLQAGQTPQAPAGAQSPAAAAQQGSPPQNLVPPAAAPAPPVHVGPTIVIDPAHGGTDNGAQGPSGTVEKDVVLRFARQIRAEFERQGFRVVMTRNDDSNPSYEDRAAVANAYRDAVFISVHVSSTGKIGTAHAYSYQSPNAAVGTTGSPANTTPKSLVVWEEAQRPYMDTSHRLADLLQTELAQRFPGSVGTSRAFAIRELRSVSAPAIAIELSSVAVPDPNMLVAMGYPLAGALVRSVQLFRPGSAVSRNISGTNAPVGAN